MPKFAAVLLVINVWIGVLTWASHRGGSIGGSDRIVHSLMKLKADKAAACFVAEKKLRDHEFQGTDDLRAYTQRATALCELDAFAWESQVLADAEGKKWDDGKLAEAFHRLGEEMQK